MKLGLQIGYWGAGPPANVPELVAEAERLGYDSMWTAEAYGSDALTPLAWWGSQTTRMQLGTSIFQMSARTPTAMAMAAMTMDHLTDGRFILGLGASGPQVVEGWYGQPYPKPLARTREYVEIVRKVLERDEPVTYDGEHYQLPYPGGAGLGQAGEVDRAPAARGHPDLPRGRGAEERRAHRRDRRRVARALLLAPRRTASTATRWPRASPVPALGGQPDDFEVACIVPVIVHDDVEEAANFYRPMLALYIGGMGAREVNFHNDVFARMGYEDEAKKIQDLYLEGKKEEAAATVPLVARRGDGARRPAGEDPRRPRALERDRGDHDADQRRRGHAADDGRARPLVRTGHRERARGPSLETRAPR